jgi:N-acetylneuraminate synthase
MVRDIRTLEVALGDGMKAPQESEWDTRLAARQQVIAARDIHKGSEFSRQDLTTARCGMGIPANALWDLLGKTAHQDYLAGTPIL